ncbi:MAG: iron-containing alcohol dehydrogenase [Synergistes jonesii]|uniref:iron-containing alcohol dehydrogenase n=1 Tax=Synergistes jonesii TaxID=2754 RepID=UPI002A75C8BC|nr:iron-containing alcohol dehydrogenase [Synergistes jonesii]MDY2985562.1 iron-containing alcohol dehydrogenase [Synergistes jonesii]
MIRIAEDIKSFTETKPFWRVELPTEVIFSGDGVRELLAKLRERGRRAFFVVDAALKKQPRFAPLFAQKNLFEFDATSSEPRTSDVDSLRAEIRELPAQPDTLVGVGGGAAMDLAKATAVCLANPRPAQCYQGFDMKMNKGADVWTMPALIGTGAEVTPIAVLRGPERKLGINNRYVQAELAVIDPELSRDAPHFNRFFTMLDSYSHHCEILASKTSAADAKADSQEGAALARYVLSHDLSRYSAELAIKSAAASLLGGSSSITGCVGAAHAISYGLSDSAPHLPHSVAVTISMCALEGVYPAGCAETKGFLAANGFHVPRASNYGVARSDIEKMTRIALGMEKLWRSCFGENWRAAATRGWIEDVYKRIVKG